MDSVALIKRPIVDDLAVKVAAFRDGQKATELSKKIAEEAYLKRWALIESFLRLAERYFGVTRDFVANLPKEERAELLNQVFEEARSRLRWKSALVHTGLALSVVGIVWILGIYDDNGAWFPDFRVRRLFKWYIENYDSGDLEKAVKSDEFAKKVKVKAADGLSIKKPEACEIVLAALPEGAMAEYEESAKSIGMMPAMLLQVKLADFLKNRCVKIFKYGDVYEYLKFQSSGKRWYWRPLREKDNLQTYNLDGKCEGYIYYGYCNGNHECRPYSKLIPSRVCKIVEEVGRQFGDKVHFLVSFYTNDPSCHYITAEALDINMFIFDSWHDDELNQLSP